MLQSIEGEVEETVAKDISKRDKLAGRQRAKMRAERRAIGAAEQYRKDVEFAIKHGRPWDLVAKPKPISFHDPHNAVAFSNKISRATQLINRAMTRKSRETEISQSND